VLSRYLNRDDPKQKAYAVDKAYNSYMHFIHASRARGVLTADLLTATTNIDWESSDELPVMRNERHWSPAGARVAAKEVADIIMSQVVYASLPRDVFQTRESTVLERDSNILQHLEGWCNTHIVRQELRSFVTEKVTPAKVALFDNANIPVVLVGTSYSGPFFNFAGSISEYTGLDDVNFQVAGGGMFTSLESFLLSGDLKDIQPAFIIWEFPFIGFANQPERISAGFRSLLPALSLPCTTLDSLLHRVISITGDPRIEGLRNEREAIMGDNFYLYIKASDLSLVEFTVEFIYGDLNAVGSAVPHDTVMLSRSTRVLNTGEFVVELSNSIVSPLRSVNVYLPKGATGTLEARLCRMN
jgi:alginate biosynthesis protein AlgX